MVYSLQRGALIQILVCRIGWEFSIKNTSWLITECLTGISCISSQAESAFGTGAVGIHTTHTHTCTCEQPMLTEVLSPHPTSLIPTTGRRNSAQPSLPLATVQEDAGQAVQMAAVVPAPLLVWCTMPFCLPARLCPTPLPAGLCLQQCCKLGAVGGGGKCCKLGGREGENTWGSQKPNLPSVPFSLRPALLVGFLGTLASRQLYHARASRFPVMEPESQETQSLSRDRKKA